MFDDGWWNSSYARLMDEQRPFLTVTLDLHDPIEIEDFAAFFAAIGAQYQKHIRDQVPEANVQARIFVKEVRQGSTVADIFHQFGDLIDILDAAVIVYSFSDLLMRVIRGLTNGKAPDDASKSDLKTFTDTVKAVAKDSNGRAVIERAVYKKGFLSKEVVFEFDTKEARRAVETIEVKKRELDRVHTADRQRVLMIFKRPDSGDANVGKRSGERVVIQDISDRDFALVYASDLAEQQIKDVLRNSEQNIFKIGFVVDVNIQKRGANISAYSVTNVHQIIDLE